MASREFEWIDYEVLLHTPLTTRMSSLIVAQDVPIVPLWHEDNVVVMNRTVAGFTLFPDARLGGLVTTTKAAIP